MTNRLVLAFSNAGKSRILTQLRERLLKIMLVSSTIVGTVLYAVALIPVLHKGLYPTIGLYGGLYVSIIILTFMPRLPYRIRTIGWLGILYILGCFNLVTSGFNVDSGLFLLTFICMAILLMDLSGGVAALVLGSVSVAILGFVNVDDHIHLVMGLPQTDPLLWIIGGIIFLLVGILLIYSLTVVVHGLEENLSKATRLAGELEQTNQSLRMSEERYRTLVETSPGLVALFDPQGTLLMVNQVGVKVFGYEQVDEMAGRNLREFVALEDISRVAEAFQQTLVSEESRDFEFLACRKDKSIFIGEVIAKVVKDETGNPQTVIVVGKDITERKNQEKQLREAKEALAEKVVETSVELEKTAGRLEELVKHGPTVIFSYRWDNQAVTYMSENVTAILGYEAECFYKDPNFWREHVYPDDRVRIAAQFDRETTSERSIYDYRFLTKSGSYKWLRSERILLRDADGNPQEFLGTSSDISDRKVSEENLVISEAKYRSLYEGMMDAYVSVDMDGHIRQFNPAYQNMLGYEAEELHQLTYLDLTPAKWHAFEAEIVEKQVLPRDYSDIYEKEYLRKDGSIFPVELRTTVIRDDQGNPTGMWAIVRDISERKLIEQILRESEQRYRDLLEHSLQGIIVFQGMRIIYANQAVTDSFGYSVSELKSMSAEEFLQIVHPDERWIYEERLENWMEGVQPPEKYSLKILNKSGAVCIIEARTVVIELQGAPALITSCIDVTAIKKAEAELKESEKMQRLILDASDALVFLVDKNDMLISGNQKFFKHMKKDAGKMRGKNVFDLLDEEPAKSRHLAFEKVRKTKKKFVFVDARDGIWFENSLYPILNETGEVSSIAVYSRNITEERRINEALRASEEHYRSLAEAAHDMIFIVNKDDQIEYVNSFGAKFLGREAADLVGEPRSNYFPAETSDHQSVNIQSVFSTGEAVSAESENKFPGRTVWLNTWLVPLKDGAGNVSSVLGVSRDITDRKRSEKALEQAHARLEERVAERTFELLDSREALRNLTAQTVAAQEEERRSISRELHDEAGQALITLKYGLSAIESELPKSETRARQKIIESMAIIDQTVAHIRGLARSLRPPVLEIGGIHLSLQDYCQETTKRTKIPIHYQGEEIPGLPDEIGISLYRFVQEALTNSFKHAQATEVSVNLKNLKGSVRLSVADNGRGMDDFTNSSGLGLLGIKERINLLGGRLEVHSQKGRGARLIAYIPKTRVAKP